MLKIVLDTNMFVSGFIFHGMVKVVFDLILENKLQMYISPKLRSEVIEKFKAFNIAVREKKKLLAFIESRGIQIEPKIKVTACRDPKDNFILELAESSQANYVITRDKDLLDLPGSIWKSTKIIKPEDFLPLLRSAKLVS